MSDSIIYLSKNETLRTIVTRRSIRQFGTQEVSDEAILTVLHAANHAPSAHNQQSWHFSVLKGQKKNELVNLVTQHAQQFPKPTSAILRMAARSIASAPVVITVMNTSELIKRGPELFLVQKENISDFCRIMEIQSSAAAVQNMLLAATSLGLATVWLGILIMIQRQVLEFLGNPEGEFMAVVPMGYALKTTAGPKKRPLDIVISNPT